MLYSEKELVGAIVVDSEGYVSGILDRVEIAEGNLFLAVRDKEGKETPLPWDMVKSANFTALGKCILLKEPIEAKSRGIEPRERPFYYGTEDVRNMLVIDSEAKIVGVAVDVTFSLTEPPILRVVAAKSIPYIEVEDIDKLVEDLVPSRYPTVKDLLTRVLVDLEKRGRFKAEDVKRNYLPQWAKSKGIKIPKKRVLDVDENQVRIVRWPEVSKVGDVILLSKAL
jgi:sporulation protein YlmC with PRC-barrel domain